MELSAVWIEMSKDVIYFASKKTRITEYKNFCSFAKIEPGKSYYDRIRVLDYLIDENIIRLEDEKIVLSKNSAPRWLGKLVVENSKSLDLIDVFNFDENAILKFDQEIIKEIGLAGEVYFLDLLAKKIPESYQEKIIHVSLTDDSKGFDIVAPNVIFPDVLDFWEVKTSVNKGDYFRFYITRNEYSSASKYKNWKLVAINKIDNKWNVFGYLESADLYDLIPSDSIDSTKWSVQQITLHKNYFKIFD